MTGFAERGDTCGGFKFSTNKARTNGGRYWPRNFDFPQARAEQQELLDADNHREVALISFSGAETHE